MAVRLIESGEWEVSIKGATTTGIALFHPGPCKGFDKPRWVWLSVGAGWVTFEFADFEAMYELAKAARENTWH